MSTPTPPAVKPPEAPVSPATFLPGITSDTIEIQVSKSAMFRVHENVLQQSPFFANALKPELVAARKGTPVDLKKEHPDTFVGYVQ